MNEQELTYTVLVSSQRALLGVITPNTRAVSIEWEGLRKLMLRVHYATTPTEDEVEDMEVVVAEIIADVPFERADLVDVVVSDEPFRKLHTLKRLVYVRKE